MEASPTDKIWGTGLSQDDPKAGDMEQMERNKLARRNINRSQGEC